MNNLLTAIMTKFSGSAVSSAVGGRIFLDAAPDGTEYPYIVFFIVSSAPERTFTERMTNTVIQVSIFSASMGASEITTIYSNLISLLDECTLTITGSTLVWMRENNLTTMLDEVVTVGAAQAVRHWAVDFDILTSLN